MSIGDSGIFYVYRGIGVNQVRSGPAVMEPGGAWGPEALAIINIDDPAKKRPNKKELVEKPGRSAKIRGRVARKRTPYIACRSPVHQIIHLSPL